MRIGMDLAKMDGIAVEILENNQQSFWVFFGIEIGG